MRKDVKDRLVMDVWLQLLSDKRTGGRTMGRLIDADKLIEHLEKVKNESASLVDMAHIIGFQSIIDAQPTAYDQNKVVEQLENLKNQVPVNRILDDIINDKPKELGQLIAYDKAIAIVKGGGVDV